MLLPVPVGELLPLPVAKGLKEGVPVLLALLLSVGEGVLVPLLLPVPELLSEPDGL